MFKTNSNRVVIQTLLFIVSFLIPFGVVQFYRVLDRLCPGLFLISLNFIKEKVLSSLCFFLFALCSYVGFDISS